MTAALVVRDVRDDDSAALIDLIESCWSEYPGCVMDADGVDAWLRAPAQAVARWAGQLWVVEDEGAVVVACGGWRPRQPDAVELKSLYVAKRARRRGIASRLAERVESTAREGGASRVELWSDTRFLDAHEFYRKRGYRQTGATRELHDPSNSVEYEFVKSLG